MDRVLLRRAKCWFGGGTAIALQCGEYRESVDIDFLCANRDGYRAIREAIALPTLGRLLTRPINHVRDVRTDRTRFRLFLKWTAPRSSSS